jgi:hypothetical protein
LSVTAVNDGNRYALVDLLLAVNSAVIAALNALLLDAVAAVILVPFGTAMAQRNIPLLVTHSDSPMFVELLQFAKLITLIVIKFKLLVNY